jgi:hypothetical protein
MELIESTKLQRIVERILDSRRKAHDMRWQMLLRDGSYAKAFFNNRVDENYVRSHNVESSPAVDTEIADMIYSHLKYQSTEPISSVGGEDALIAFLEVAMKTTNMKRIMDKYMSTQTQVELAFLWRNVSMLKSLDDGEMLMEFFEEFVKLVCRLPPLSLSSIWLEQPQHKTQHEVKPEEETSSGHNGFLSIPEINYLSDQYNAPDLHDPYFILVKFFETVEQYTITSNSNRKGLLLSVCLALAIKSGRASLLLRTVCWMNENRHAMMEFDFDILKDLEASLKGLVTSEKSEQAANLTDVLLVDPLLDENDISSCSGFNDALLVRRMEGCMALSFGKADHGKLGHGDTQVHRLIPTVIESLQHACITKVASMSTYTLAADSNGNAYVWGTGGSASSTVGLRNDIQPQVLEALPNKAVVKDVACGLGHALFLVEGGRVYAWGNGGNGRLGLGNCADRTDSCLITGNR